MACLIANEFDHDWLFFAHNFGIVSLTSLKTVVYFKIFMTFYFYEFYHFYIVHLEVDQRSIDLRVFPLFV